MAIIPSLFWYNSITGNTENCYVIILVRVFVEHTPYIVYGTIFFLSLRIYHVGRREKIIFSTNDQ